MNSFVPMGGKLANKKFMFFIFSSFLFLFLFSPFVISRILQFAYAYRVSTVKRPSCRLLFLHQLGSDSAIGALQKVTTLTEECRVNIGLWKSCSLHCGAIYTHTHTREREIRDRLCGLVVRVPGYRSWGPGSIPRSYQIFWEVVGLERGPLSLVSTTEELLAKQSRGSGLEIREYGRRDPSRWPRDTLYPQKLALTSPTSGGRWVGIVRSQTQATEVLFLRGR
jgi:hypothetical protein